MVETTLNAPFSLRATNAGFSLQLQVDAGLTVPPQVNVRLYPGVFSAKISTNRGSVTKEGVIPLDIEREVVQFSGSETGTTNFPIVTLNSVDTFGSLFDINGNPIFASFGKDGFILRASKPVYGAVEVSYQTTYVLLRYLPEIIDNPDGSTTVNYGAILAFKDGVVAVLQIPIPDPQGGDFQEVYRTVSEMVVNELGSWEKPPGWTGQTGSPTWPGGQPDPEDPSILIERPHELGYVTSIGSTFTRSFFVPIENPQKQVTGFVPEKEVKATSGGGPFDDQLAKPQVQEFIAAAEARIL